jgi:hypothetical protein
MVADDNKWTDEQIVEWVTIIAICLFVFMPYEMIELSETGLGKLFFVSIIVYYSMVEPIYGIVACCIVIVYYQLDLYKSVIAMHRDTLLLENMYNEVEAFSENTTTNASANTTVNKTLESYTVGDSSVFSYIPFADPENFYESEWLRGGSNGGSKKKELLDNFRKEHCDEKKQLKYKGGIVRPEMADHVFREIQFPDESAKCNPCEESCDFSIIEERLNREEGLRPASSADSEIDWNQFFGHYLVKPVESMADDANIFKTQVSEFISRFSQ